MASRIDAAVRLAKERSILMHKDIEELTRQAFFSGASAAARMQMFKMKISAKHYHAACLYVIRRMGGYSEGIDAALDDLAGSFLFNDPSSNAVNSNETPPHLDQRASLKTVRSQILAEFQMGVAAGREKTAGVVVSYARVIELVPAAIQEVEELSLSDDDREDIIDHIKSVEDEAKKPTPDDRRLRRIANRIWNELETVKDAAMTAGAATPDTAAVVALLTLIG